MLDEDGAVGKLYNAKTTPEMFVINPEGILAYKGAIDDKADTDESSIARATNFGQAALDEVKAGKPVTQTSTKSYGGTIKC